MKFQPTKSQLLNTAIVLLTVLIVMQIYGIFFGTVTDNNAPWKAQNDSTHTTIQINILNGCGVSGVGNTLMNFCRQASYDVVETGNYSSFDVTETMVIDRVGKTDEALRLAGLLGVRKKNIVQQFSSDHPVSLSVIIGKDYKNLIPWK